MKHMTIAAVVLAAILAGCGPSVPEAKQQAEVRWSEARARVVFGVAEQHLETGQLDLARAKAAETLLLDPDSTQARVLLGKVFIEQGQYEQAVRELQIAREAIGESAEVHYLLGVAEEKSGRLGDALASYRRAYALDTRNTAPILAAAEVLVGMGRLNEAKLYLESHAPQIRDDPGVHELAGRISMMQERYAEAAESFQQAVDLAPKNPLYLESLGRAQFHAGRYTRALETLRTLLEAHDENAPAWVYTMIGDCHMALARALDARRAYEKASELKPASPGVWTNLAKAALALEDPARAILAARQALHLRPEDPDAKMILGYGLLESGRFAEAVRLLKLAVQAHPGHGTLYCVLGRAYAAQGHRDRARDCYARALACEPSNVLAKRLLAGATAGDSSGAR